MNNGRRTVAGMLAVIAVSLPAALVPAATAQCNNPDPSPDCGNAQIGILGNFVQGCDAFGGSDDPTTPEAGDGWSGLAFPFQTGGANVGAISFTLNTNRAGGDIWIMGNTDALGICPTDCQAVPSGATDVPDLLALLAAWGGPPTPGTTCDLDGTGVIAVPDLLTLLAAWGPCPPSTLCGQPDITNVLATICCGLEALATGVVHTINFGSVATSASEPTWAVFVGRTGLAGMNDIDGDGTADEFHFNGGSFPSHQVARECQIDVKGDCLAPSSPNQAFANISAASIGAPGEWEDLHDSDLGTPYCVSLSASVLNDGVDCVNNPAQIGVCCLPGDGVNTFPSCDQTVIGWQCGLDGGIFATYNSVCFLNPYGACSCGPGVGSCLAERLGETGCESLACCEVICSLDSACCSFEWDQNCADLAAANVVACLPDLDSPAPLTIVTGPGTPGTEPWLSVSPDVYASYMVDFAGYDSSPAGSDPENDDHYNPVGPHAIVFNPVTQEYEPEGPTFSTGFMFFTGGTGPPPANGRGREVLAATNSGWHNSFNDSSMVKQVLTAHVASDTNADAINDTLTGGSFRVLLLDNSVDITIAVTQSVMIEPGSGLAVYDLTYTMTNNSVDGGGLPIAATFELMRQYDGDHNWVGDATNDQVGTTWNADGGPGGRFVVMREVGDPDTAFTMSSPDADAYSGGKSGDDPDGPGGIDPHSCGTCGIVWDNFGLPAPWENNISLVGTLTDGFSNTSIDPADAATYLRIPVSMAASEAGKVITFRAAYGSGGPVQPVDCNGNGVPDSQDIAVGTSLDLNGNGVPDECESILNFEVPQEFAAAGEPIIEAVGDLDGNGTVDVVTVIPGGDPMVNGVIQVFLNQGTDMVGQWLGLVANDPVTVGLEPSGVAVGLFNADPFVDVAVTNASDNTVSILFNQGTGDGSLFPPVHIIVGNRPSAIVAADFNLDTFVDLAVTNQLDNNVMLLLNDGTGNFPPPPPPGGGGFAAGGFATFPSGGEGVSLVTDDFDGNKRPDMAGTERTAGLARATGAAFVLLGLGDGTFDPVAVHNVGLDPLHLASADLQRDGAKDIITVNSGDATISILINLLNGTFSPALTIPVGLTPRSIAAVDLNGDGDNDLAVVAIDPLIGPSVQVLANRIDLGGGLVFEDPVGFGVDADPNFVVSADLNNDGIFDLVTVNADDGVTGGSVTVLLGDPLPPL